MKFIVIEGPDGSGKTTQVKMAAEALRSFGRRVMVEREPFNYHNLVKDDTGTALEVAQRFVNDRVAHIAHMTHQIHEAAAKGETIDYVICDRYALSTLVYQGSTCTDLKNNNIIALHEREDLWVPDLQIVLFGSQGFADRVASRGDKKYGYAGTAASVNRAYWRFAQVNQEAVKVTHGLSVIFGNRSASVLATETVQHVHDAIMLLISCL